MTKKQASKLYKLLLNDEYIANFDDIKKILDISTLFQVYYERVNPTFYKNGNYYDYEYALVDSLIEQDFENGYVDAFDVLKEEDLLSFEVEEIKYYDKSWIE